MATPTISLELLEHFSPILLFILVFAIVYAMFQWAKILGENKVIHSVIALVISIFISFFSEGASRMIKFMVPWFTILAIFITFSIMLYKIFGATDSDVRSVIKERSDIQWTLFIVIVIIMLGAFSQAYGQGQLSLTTDENTTPSTQSSNLGNPGTTDTASGSFNQNLGATFYHPKVLGMLFLFIVGSLAVATLSRPVTKT